MTATGAVNDDERLGADRRRMTILFTSAGRNVALVRCFRTAATTAGIALRVMAIDQRPEEAPACLLAELALAAPSPEAEDYAAHVLSLCREHGATLVVPCGVRELGPLSAAEKGFAEIGVSLALAPAALVDRMLDLWQWQEIALGAGAAVPRIGARGAIADDPNGWRWPLVARPLKIGGEGPPARVIRTPTELLLLDPARAVVLQEMPRGERFVIQLLFGRDGTLLGIAPCRVLAAPGGTVATTANDRKLIALARRIAELIPDARGPVVIEAVRQADGAILIDRMLPILTDIYPLIDCAGAKMSEALIAEAQGQEVERQIRMADRFTMLTYPAPLFIAG
ncbi:MAG TPA: hypothetical protein VFT56_09605 [Sphingomonas sp.]|nr:hypothetical protein [Sphingomonas sp.]